eukprot:scaffold667291_cov107-Prasinocladus_malaysianus.AAC.2
MYNVHKALLPYKGLPDLPDKQELGPAKFYMDYHSDLMRMRLENDGARARMQPNDVTMDDFIDAHYNESSRRRELPDLLLPLGSADQSTEQYDDEEAEAQQYADAATYQWAPVDLRSADITMRYDADTKSEARHFYKTMM